MIDDTRKQELLEAFDVLVKHNLYRRRQLCGRVTGKAKSRAATAKAGKEIPHPGKFRKNN